VFTLVLAKPFRPRADEEHERHEEQEEKPITSSAAQVSRDAAGTVVITMGPAAQKEVGIATEILKPTLLPVEVEAYGYVLDPAPLSRLNADLASAQASLDASREQYHRTGRLYAEQKNASLRDLQSAKSTYLSDKARGEALEQQLLDTWGRQIAQIDSRARGNLVSALVERREAIARVTAPVGEPLDIPHGGASVFVLGHEEQPVHTQAVYETPSIDQQMQGQAFLLLIATQGFAIRPGAAVFARLLTSGKPEQGVIVPRAAVVRFADKEWIYRKLASDRFKRIEIEPAETTQQGYFVTENLEPGARVVIAGAQTLLSEELKAQIQPRE
jgi:hypothetical protein